ncbi:MAG: hypothetical protein M1812_007639 [Candelaria pacifica]|nr:MAG: hypothetical protein M1812_007639 [Candelaria pacifica]
MRHYPYDHILFYPGHTCRTCKLLKPARSKHCSICKTCVAKHDHHCIWLNNCLGRGNYQYFILMLFFTGILLSYGAYLAYIILSDLLQGTLSSAGSGQHWSAGKPWKVYFQFWAWAIVHYVRIGFVGLLALMCSPLAWGLLIYHLYLIWAGMTTNESVKWSELREDVEDGLVFIRMKLGGKALSGPANHIATAGLAQGKDREKEWEDEEEEQTDLAGDDTEPRVKWPVSTNQVVVRTSNGESPPLPRSGRVQGVQGWRRVEGLQEINNIYDLGFWDNIWGIFESG